jgi:hypothetical protein
MTKTIHVHLGKDQGLNHIVCAHLEAGKLGLQWMKKPEDSLLDMKDDGRWWASKSAISRKCLSIEGSLPLGMTIAGLTIRTLDEAMMLIEKRRQAPIRRKP